MRHPPHWKPHHPHWHPDRSHKQRFLFGRFAFIFGVMIFFFLAALGVIGGMIFGPFREFAPHEGRLLLLICGVPFGFLLLSGLFGGWVFRRFGAPLADVMAAADAVASGDLSVRVSEAAPGEIGRLAVSFNRMTGELERAEQQRRNLTADVAHELRTPLHIIQGNLEGILDGVYPPSEPIITSTLEETQLLARLVNDLQTLTLAEANQLALHKTRFSVAELLNETAASFKVQAAENGLTLDLSLDAEANKLEIEADPDRISQALKNLLANALRHTPPGGWIRLSAASIQGAVRLVVQDTGAGIAAEDLPFIFDRFWKGDPARSRQQGAGSGLGLAITRQLVQAHGGKIGVESKLGEGTTFIIELPA